MTGEVQANNLPGVQHPEAANQPPEGKHNQPAGGSTENVGQATERLLGDVWGSFKNTLISQGDGAVQLSNHVLGTRIAEIQLNKVDDPNSSWAAWGANLTGQAGAMALEFMGLRKLGALAGAAKFLVKGSAAEAIAGSEATVGLPGWMGRLGSVQETATTKLASTVAFGGLMGGVFTPTNDPQHFWRDRGINTFSSVTSMLTMTSASMGMESAGTALARRATSGIGARLLASTLANGFVNNLIGGYAGGALGDIATTKLNGQQIDWSQANRAGAEFALIGMGTHALNMGGATVHQLTEQRAGTDVTNARYYADKLGLTEADQRSGNQAEFRVLAGGDQLANLQAQLSPGAIPEAARAEVSARQKIHTVLSGLFGDSFSKYGTAGTLLLNHGEVNAAAAARADLIAGCSPFFDKALQAKDVFRGRSQGKADRQPVWMSADASFQKVILTRGIEAPIAPEGFLEAVRLGKVDPLNPRQALYIDDKGHVQTAHILMGSESETPIWLGKFAPNGTIDDVTGEFAAPGAAVDKRVLAVFPDPLADSARLPQATWRKPSGDMQVFYAGPAAEIGGVPYVWIESTSLPLGRQGVPADQVKVQREPTADDQNTVNDLLSMPADLNNIETIVPVYETLARTPGLDRQVRQMFLDNLRDPQKRAAIEAIEGFYDIDAPGSSYDRYLSPTEQAYFEQKIKTFIESEGGNKTAQHVAEQLDRLIGNNPNLRLALRNYARLLQSDPAYAGDPKIRAALHAHFSDPANVAKPLPLVFAEMVDTYFNRVRDGQATLPESMQEKPTNAEMLVANFGGTARTLHFTPEDLSGTPAAAPAELVDPNSAGGARTSTSIGGNTFEAPAIEGMAAANDADSAAPKPALSQEATLSLAKMRSDDPEKSQEGTLELARLMNEPGLAGAFSEWRSHAVDVFSTLGTEEMQALPDQTVRAFLLGNMSSVPLDQTTAVLRDRIATLQRLASVFNDAPKDGAKPEEAGSEASLANAQIIERIVELAKDQPTMLKPLLYKLTGKFGGELKTEITRRLSSGEGTIADINAEYLDKYLGLSKNRSLRDLPDAITRLRELSAENPDKFVNLVKEPFDRPDRFAKPKPGEAEVQKARQKLNESYSQLIATLALRAHTLDELANIGMLAKARNPKLKAATAELVPKGTPAWTAVEQRVDALIDNNPDLITVSSSDLARSMTALPKRPALPETPEQQAAREAKERQAAQAKEAAERARAETQRLANEAEARRLAAEAALQRQRDLDAEQARLQQDEQNRQRQAAAAQAAQQEKAERIANLGSGGVSKLIALDDELDTRLSHTAAADISERIQAKPIVDDKLQKNLTGNQVEFRQLFDGGQYAVFKSKGAAEKVADSLSDYLKPRLGAIELEATVVPADGGFVIMVDGTLKTGENFAATPRFGADSQMEGLSRFGGDEAKDALQQMQAAAGTTGNSAPAADPMETSKPVEHETSPLTPVAEVIPVPVVEEAAPPAPAPEPIAEPVVEQRAADLPPERIERALAPEELARMDQEAQLAGVPMRYSGEAFDPSGYQIELRPLDGDALGPRFASLADEDEASLLSIYVGEKMQEVTGGTLVSDQQTALKLTDGTFTPIVTIELPSGEISRGTPSFDSDGHLAGLTSFSGGDLPAISKAASPSEASPAQRAEQPVLARTQPQFSDGVADLALLKELSKKQAAPTPEEQSIYGDKVEKHQFKQKDPTSGEERVVRSYWLPVDEGNGKQLRLVGRTIDGLPSTLAKEHFAAQIGLSREAAFKQDLFPERATAPGGDVKETKLPTGWLFEYGGPKLAGETNKPTGADEDAAAFPGEGKGAVVFSQTLKDAANNNQPYELTKVVYPGGLKVTVDPAHSIVAGELPGGARFFAEGTMNNYQFISTNVRYTGLGVDAVPPQEAKLTFNRSNYTLTFETPQSATFPEGSKFVRTATGAFEMTGTRVKMAVAGDQAEAASAVLPAATGESDPAAAATLPASPPVEEVAVENDPPPVAAPSVGAPDPSAQPTSSSSAAADALLEDSAEPPVTEPVVAKPAAAEAAITQPAAAEAKGDAAPIAAASASMDPLSEGDAPEGETVNDALETEPAYEDLGWTEQLQQIEQALDIGGEWAINTVNLKVLTFDQRIALGELPHLSVLAYGAPDVAGRGFAAFKASAATAEAREEAQQSAWTAVDGVKSLLETVLPPDVVHISGEVHSVNFEGEEEPYLTPVLQFRWHNGSEDVTRVAIDVDAASNEVLGVNTLSRESFEKDLAKEPLASAKWSKLSKQLETKVPFADQANVDNYLYDLLGVGRNASTEAINRVYEDLKQYCDPSVYPDDAEAAAQFKAITEAHEVLSDPAKRAAYDERFGQSLTAREAELKLTGIPWTFKEVNSHFSDFDQPIDASGAELRLQQFSNPEIADRGIATYSTEGTAAQLKNSVVAKLTSLLDKNYGTVSGGVDKVEMPGRETIYMPWVRVELETKGKDTVQAPIAIDRNGIVQGLAPLSGELPAEVSDPLRDLNLHKLKQTIKAAQMQPEAGVGIARDTNEQQPPQRSSEPASEQKPAPAKPAAAPVAYRPKRPVSFDQVTEHKLLSAMTRGASDEAKQKQLVDKLLSMARKDGTIDVSRLVDKLNHKRWGETIRMRLEELLSKEVANPGSVPTYRFNPDYVHMEVRLPEDYKFMPGVADHLLSLYATDGRQLNFVMTPPRWPEIPAAAQAKQASNRGFDRNQRPPKPPDVELRFMYRDVMGVLSTYAQSPEPLTNISRLLKPRLERNEENDINAFRKTMVEKSGELTAALSELMNETDANWEYVQERLAALAALNPEGMQVRRPRLGTASAARNTGNSDDAARLNQMRAEQEAALLKLGAVPVSDDDGDGERRGDRPRGRHGNAGRRGRNDRRERDDY